MNKKTVKKLAENAVGEVEEYSAKPKNVNLSVSEGDTTPMMEVVTIAAERAVDVTAA